jgi:hypothetical protein
MILRVNVSAAQVHHSSGVDLTGVTRTGREQASTTVGASGSDDGDERTFHRDSVPAGALPHTWRREASQEESSGVDRSTIKRTKE